RLSESAKPTSAGISSPVKSRGIMVLPGICPCDSPPTLTQTLYRASPGVAGDRLSLSIKDGIPIFLAKWQCQMPPAVRRPQMYFGKGNLKMADYDRQTLGARAGSALAIDEGLRSYMLRVYNYMGLGLVVTGLAAWFAANAAVTTDRAL